MNNRFSAKANRWLFSLTGLLFLANGIFNISYNKLEPLGMTLGVLILIGGWFYLFYGIFAFSQGSKFAPKIAFDESTIELKNSIWKSTTTLKWSEVSSITFESFDIIFQLQDHSASFSYKANPETSISIKQSIRDVAAQKNIFVTGG